MKIFKRLFKFYGDKIEETSSSENNSSQSKKPNSPELATAAYEGNLEDVIELLASGKSPNSAKPNEEDRLLSGVLVNMRHTALCNAASEGHHEIVKALLKAGANPNLLDTDCSYQWSPLLHAAYSGNLECVKLLINAGANIHFREPRLKHSVLTHAAKADKIDIVIHLLKSGFDIMKTPDLGFSCGGARMDVIAQLIDLKNGHADLNYVIERLEALS